MNKQLVAFAQEWSEKAQTRIAIIEGNESVCYVGGHKYGLREAGSRSAEEILREVKRERA